MSRATPPPEHQTDIEVLEQCKENVLPISTGRSASKLSTLLTSDRKSVDAQLREGHQKFKDEIAAVENGTIDEDDSLDVYHRYVRWTLSSYPSGPSHASHLVPLLELTTRRFVKDARYKSDLRYLRLWILYAKYVDTPRDIYRFLEANQIGTGAASFYEEWAGVEENNNNYKEADSVFQLGVNRKAEPLSRLKKRRDAFQARMLLLPPPEERSSTPPLSASTSRRGLASSQGLGQSTSKAPNGALFAVFSDEGKKDENGQTSGWEDLGTRDSRRRENIKEATAWKGETLSMSTGSSFGGERLEVFRDEDAGATVKRSASTKEEVFSARSLRRPSEAESLRSNPFKNYADTSDPAVSFDLPTAELQASKSKRSSSKTLAANATKQPKKALASSTAKKEQVASPLAEVYPEDETGHLECSFEEIFAMRRGLYSLDGSKQAKWDAKAQPEWMGEAARSGEAFAVDQNGNAILYDERGEGTFTYLRERQAAERAKRKKEEARKAEEARLAEEAKAKEVEKRWMEASAKSFSLKQISPVRPATQTRPSEKLPSPTINTKAALAEVNDMFGSTMRFDDSIGSATEDEATLSEIDENEIQPSQASQPGDYVNDSFWGPVQSQASQPSQSAQDRHRSPLLDVDDSDSDITPPAHHQADENGGRKPLARDAASRGLRAKPLAAAAPAPQPEDEGSETESEPEDQTTPFPAMRAPAPSAKIEIFQDEEPRQVSPRRKSGFRMGRRPPGEESRFAPMVDTMEPIVERTLEFAGAANALRAQPALVEEEEEDLDEAEQAFVEDDAEEANQAIEGNILSAESSFRPRPLSPVTEQPSADLSLPSTNSIETPADRKQSFRNFNTSDSSLQLNEGLSITGHQSYTTSMVLDATSTGIPNPCVPQSPAVLDILGSASKDQPIEGHHDLSRQTAAKLADIEKHLKAKSRKSASNSEEGCFLQLGKQLFSVRTKLGEGGFGAVFRVANTEALEKEDDDRPAFLALKVERPAATWEFSILNRLRSRTASNPRVQQSIIIPYSLYQFADESHMLLEVCDQGTLLDAVNQAATSGIGAAGGQAGMDEPLAIFFVVELLRVLEGFHSAGFIHADFKIDNVLVRLDEVVGGSRAWSSQYKRDGTAGWASKGIKIIDYGRAIDTRAFPAGQRFIGDWPADGRDCIEMREGRPWTYEPDYHGLAGIAYTLLFGKHFEEDATTPTQTGLQLAGKPFRRYHQVDLWTRLFGLLLDPQSVAQQVPVTAHLTAIREEMEDWLEKNADKGGKNLRSLLRKLEISHLSR